MRKMMFWMVLISFFVSFQVQAAEEKEEKKEYTDEEVAEMINNPLGNLWLMFNQNDTTWYGGDALAPGENDKVMNTLVLNPVMPMQITENWKFVFRPFIPLNSFDLPSNSSSSDSEANEDWQRETGLGDIVLFNVFTTNEGSKPPNIFGAGFTMSLDTASDDVLGTGKWSAGPALLGLHLTDKWILGGIFQHFWSYAGDDDRDDVNKSDFQYILRYRATPTTNIGISPNITYDWDAESGNKLTLPIGIGVDTMIKLGPMPTKIGIELHYYVESPDDFGPEWRLRFFFTPVIPSPGWSKKAMF